MRRNTKFTFTKKEDRPALSVSEARYWKAILSKICKIGFEHEYNLVTPKGNCNGDSFVCPCSNPKKETTKCNEKCAIYTSCSLLTEFECPGIYCIHFVSPCVTCKDALRDCKRCSLYRDPEKIPSEIRKKIEKELVPTNNLSNPGNTGTYSVTTDGSLEGDSGVEVTTVGRRINYNGFFKQASIINKTCMERGAFLNERTSVHMHLIAGYFNISTRNGGVEIKYSKRENKHMTSSILELEKHVPEIILANFHQLIRRYENALTWITSAGNSINHLTRWSKFRKPISKYSSLRTSMSKVCKQIEVNTDNNGKYTFVSYFNTIFNKEGDVSRLHVEARYCDGIFSPSAVASLGILLYSLLMKAVSLSQYGILHSGDAEYMTQAKDIQRTLLNNDGNYSGPRYSNTSNFAPYIETVRRQADEMINILQDELKIHGPAYDILKSLADKPCSLRLIEGSSWDDIERELTEKEDESIKAKNILELVDTFFLDDCVDQKEWASFISEELKMKPNQIQEELDKLTKKNILIWDPSIGTFIRRQ